MGIATRILLEEFCGQLGGLITSHEDLERMLLHLATHAMNLAFGHHVALIQQNNPIRHEIHLMKNVARDYEVHPLIRELLEETNRLGPRHRIQTVQRLVENHNLGIVGDRLRQTYPLPHAFAVGSDLTIRCVEQVDARGRASSDGLTRRARTHGRRIQLMN
jgi:hypothetical protein